MADEMRLYERAALKDFLARSLTGSSWTPISRPFNSATESHSTSMVGISVASPRGFEPRYHRERLNFPLCRFSSPSVSLDSC